jgi:translation initiation factor IF-2
VPIRIYAFAKELGFDNKQLLDVCEKVDIKGKGSALASLDDDEVAKIKSFLDGGGATAAEPEPEVLTPMRPEPSRQRKIVDLPDKVSSKTDEAPEPEADDEVADEVAEPEVAEVVAEEVTEAPAEPVAEAPVEEEPVEEEPSEPEAAETVETPEDAAESKKKSAKSMVGSLLDRMRMNKPNASVRPVNPMAPIRPGGARKPAAVRNLDQRESKPADGEEKKKEVRKKTGLNVKLAAMPEVKQPKPGSTSTGEKVQKPDIALPQDAIAKARSGAAPLEQFTKSSKVKKKGKGAKAGEDASELPSAVRRAGRRPEMIGGFGGGRRNMRDRRPRSYNRHRRKSGVNTAAPRKDSVVLQLPCSVREFSEAAGVPAIQALLTIKQLGDESNKTINSQLEDEMVEVLLDHFKAEVEVRQAKSLEESLMDEINPENDDPDALEPRAPIVTFLGHVDHGKTSLLDALIGIDVVSGEAGGITQSIRAYEIMKGDQKIAFVDTPGHEAFTEMRARGANVTDIAVLVVAADDGIMPQTEEAISHAKAAGVPIIVALNKIDIPGVTADKAMQDLATHDLLPSEWGGEIEVVKTSAINGTGLDELLETILVTAELHEYQANPERPAYGTCLESHQESDRGVVAKVIVQGGTLKVGDVVVCGQAFGKVKAMHDTLKRNKKHNEAEPSTPINLTGLDVAPGAGEKFYVVDDIAKAREVAASREFQSRTDRVGGFTTKISLEEIQRRLEAGNLADDTAEMITLNLILRADAKGSLEAIQKELGKISHPEIRIKVLQALAGGVTVADVRLADASEAIIVGFNVVPDEAARSLADELQVEVRRYDVIYKIVDDLKAVLEGKLKPEEQVVETGMAMILKTFSVSRTGTIAGCRVMRGSIERDCRMRVIRDSRIIGDYAIDSLKREKDDAKEVQRGMECGIKLDGFNDVKEGDTLEAYKIEEIARTL